MTILRIMTAYHQGLCDSMCPRLDGRPHELGSYIAVGPTGYTGTLWSQLSERIMQDGMMGHGGDQGIWPDNYFGYSNTDVWPDQIVPIINRFSIENLARVRHVRSNYMIRKPRPIALPG